MERSQLIKFNEPALPALSEEKQVELIHLFDKFRAVRAFVLDVDGVLTDNRVHLTESGEQLRTMNIRDGHGIRIALQNGYPFCVITGGRSMGVIKRLTILGIEHIYSGVSEKLPVLEQFLEIFRFQPTEVCYMGDDVPDLEVMRKVGLAACPADAIPEVRAVADYISPFMGGSGCVRDLIEKVLKTQGKWQF
ncbi:MAG: HAD-IIIA family hydrolase [Saprospiraceae bacterium]|nr:HAD-IIIA family hydrolase [Saprospiraceae bacterium]MDW8484656.1 HAD-IIIA family hydrolase [Saprospiraceae bacterium]